MPIFKDFFQARKPLSEEQQKEVAVALLQETMPIALQNPKKAMAMLNRKGKPAYEVLRIGGQIHNEFRAFVEKIWALLGYTEPLPSFAVEVVSWDTWQYPMVKDLSEKAQSSKAEILYLTPPLQRSPRDAMAELEALRQFTDPDIAMVTVGEEGMFFRRSFILEAAKELSPDSEEVGQDMEDQAKAMGLKVCVIVA